MNNSTAKITAKTTEMVENHSFVAMLLAALCLAFAVNYFMFGPGSDGGSGLGGTGKFGGESGLGGTGKGPDSGAGFKLGATENDEQETFTNTLLPQNNDIEPIPLLDPLLESIAQSMVSPNLEFDVKKLRLSLADVPVQERQNKNSGVEFLEANMAVKNNDVANLVEKITLEDTALISQFLSEEIEQATTQVLVSSLDILNGLMVAESQTRFESISENIDQNMSLVNSSIRNRLSVPVRPERPDRFAGPARITPVQRIDIPAPPPVRPMRTLSTLLNK